MSKQSLKYVAAISFAVFSALYFYIPFPVAEEYKTFLTISTFLFAVFSGFFISRQGARYSSIREKIATFDGDMSFLYRSSGHFGAHAQERVGEIIQNHYKPIFENKAWDWYFNHKSTTLTSLHELLENELKDQSLSSIKNAVLSQALVALREAQTLRKHLVALYQERIPRFQWVLIIVLTAILLLTLSTLPSQGVLLASLLKGAFAMSVLVVVLLLRQLDQLKFFEGTIGENSARDVLDIIKGVR